MNTAVETSQLAKRYASTWALRECSVSIPQGRVAALVGPNGAGKTTLLHLAMGISEPTTGRVEVFGWSPHEQPLLALARVGFVVADHRLLTGPRNDVERIAARHTVVHQRHGDRQSTCLLAGDPLAVEAACTAEPACLLETPPLEEIVLAYLGQPVPSPTPAKPRLEVAS